MASGLIKRKNWFQSNIMCMAESGTFLKGVFLLPAGVVHYPAGVGNCVLTMHNILEGQTGEQVIKMSVACHLIVFDSELNNVCS